MNLKLIVLILMLSAVGLFACSKEKGQAKVSGDLNGLMTVEINRAISFNWDNPNSVIVRDSLFAESVLHLEEELDNLIGLITSKEKTPARTCGLDRTLSIGDFAFIFLDEAEGIPYYTALNMQFDVLIQGCKYPLGLFDYIGENQDLVKSELKAYFESKR